MSPRRTRRGTIRESVNDTSVVNSSLKSASKTLRSSRRTNKSQSAKALEEDSDSNVELNSVVDHVAATSFMNDTSTNTRKRRRKSQEILINNDISSSSLTAEESKTKSQKKKNDSKSKKSKGQNKANKSEILENNSLISEDESFKSQTKKNESKSPKPKRQYKNNKSETIEKNLFISEDESFSKSQKDERQESFNQNNVSKDKETSNTKSKKKVKLNDQNSSLNKNECKTPKRSSKKHSLKNVKSSEDVTPESSPLNVSLTPNRSTKTPRKSPMNLGSPKSHSKDSFKLLNVPRKLSITVSPPSSEKSNTSSPQYNPDIVLTKNIDVSHTSSKSTSKHSSSKRKSSSSPEVRPRFSKSPKIVFKTPKSKSSKKSPKKVSPKNVSPTKSNKADKNASPLKSKQSLDKLKKSPKATSSAKATNTSESEKSNPTIIVSEESTELTKLDSLLKSKLSPNIVQPKKSSKSPKSVSPLKKVPKIVSSKKSPKFISPPSSKKMPKIVLTMKSKKSPLKSSKSLSKSKISPKVISPSKLKRASVKIQPRKSIVNNSLSNNSIMSPKVVVNKLSTPHLKSTLSTKANQPSINLVPVDHPVQSFTPDQKLKKQSIKSAISEPISNAESFNFRTSTPRSVVDRRLLNMKSTNTSTPKEKSKRTLNLISNKQGISPNQSKNSVVLNGSSIPKSKIIKRLNNQPKIEVDHPLLEDESEPSLNDSSLIHMSDVMDFDTPQKDNTFGINKSNSSTPGKRKSRKDNNSGTFEIKNNSNSSTKAKSVKDNTYELECPKTPGLQKKSNKRTSDEAGLTENDEREPKRSCRVQFASLDLTNQERSSNINRIVTPGHAIQKKRAIVSISKMMTPENHSLINTAGSTTKAGSTITTQSKAPVSTSANKRHSKSSNLLSSRKSINEVQSASVKRLSRPKIITKSEKKIGIKTPVARKIPNFAEIHQKNFSKMESLVDLKKRVEKRHVVLNTASSSTKKVNPAKLQNGNSKPAPPDSTDSAYNRFGFKLRKNDAINLISKKQAGTVESRETKREDARSALKGVRMNRRFELQMKSRMKNS